MKHVRIVGLAVVAAAALMALVGASTASATVLCKTIPAGSPTGTTCPAGWALQAGDKIHATLTTGTDGTLTTNETFKPNITCKKTTIEVEITAEGSATATARGNVTALTIEECGENEVKTLTKGSVEIHWIEGTHNGTLTGTGTEITTVTPSIFGNIHCIYTTNATDLGTVTGGEPAILTANSQALGKLVTSSLCPPAPTWDANYKVTNHFKLYVASIT